MLLDPFGSDLYVLGTWYMLPHALSALYSYSDLGIYFPCPYAVGTCIRCHDWAVGPCATRRGHRPCSSTSLSEVLHWEYGLSASYLSDVCTLDVGMCCVRW